MKYFKTEYKHC